MADDAFAAYNKKEYAVAEDKVGQALTLRPDVMKLWLLRIYAVQNQGRTQDALNISEQALVQFPGDPALKVARNNLYAVLHPVLAFPKAARALSGTSQAWRLADAAYKSYASGRYVESEKNARQSLRFQPAQPEIRSLLVHALERQGNIKAAAQEADVALARKPANEMLQALRDRMYRSLAASPALAAWGHYQLGEYDKARRFAGQAVRYAPDISSYQHLLMGALLAAKEYAQADATASAALAYDAENPFSLAMRAYARQRLGLYAQAKKDLDLAAHQDWLSGQQLVNLRRISADILLVGSKRDQGRVRETTPVVSCSVYSQDVLCNVLPAGSSLDGKGPGYQAASEAYVAFARKDYSAAVKFGLQASQEAPDDLSYRLLLVNALALEGDKYRARKEFKPLAGMESLPPANFLDGAYAAQRLSYNDIAVEWFSRAIDIHDSGGMEMDSSSSYNIRQAISDLDRSWGFNAALGYGTVGVMNPSFAPSLSERKTLQSSAEVYWRPPNIGLRDGSRFELYARANEAHYDGTGGATGSSTLQGVAGARWKPFGQQNFVFAVERLFRIGTNSRNDWLLRAAWSDGQGGALRVDKSNWQYWHIYAEGDYFVKNPQTIGTLEGRYGRSFRFDNVSSNLAITPYLSLNANYDNLLATRSTVGVGPGLNFRYWFRDDKYHAHQSFVDFNVQYRFRIAGDDRSNGIFAGFYFSY
ncbi:hypothetical protein H0A65_05700 [Alcaligenaceae bacterium]|nr:hypothetical protein [Alcaligenaceae bacterium]